MQPLMVDPQQGASCAQPWVTSPCQGPWTDPTAFYWVTGEKLQSDWPGWGGYGLAALGENLLEGLPIKQPHLEAFLEGAWVAWKDQEVPGSGWGVKSLVNLADLNDVVGLAG